MIDQSHRNTIFVEDAKILRHAAFDGDQYILKLAAPKTAKNALPGSFVHLQCDDLLPMRRPMSLMRVDANKGEVDILYKKHGHGTALLAQRKEGESLSLMGPIGIPFKLENYKRKPLLIGGGVGLPPMVFLAEHLKDYAKKFKQDLSPFVIMGSEVPFPFTTKPSQIMIDGMPDGVIATMPLMEDWNIACRLTSLQGYAGCHEGYVTDLARCWLDAMNAEQRSEVEIFSCGPTPMLKAVKALAAEYDLPCQVSLEEYMACAVGGCAGCVVEIETENGSAMKRVCVDGPIFEASTVVFP
ncbi:MAG: dihydroorotate dehydrogenase electron transfer subunit [Gammaproteobacteria bacterium]